MGLGLGLYGGRTALLALTTPKEEYAKLFGYCNAAMKGSAIVMPIIIGYLAKISWRHPFLINIIPLITAVVMFFWMKEPEKVENDAEKTTENKAKTSQGKLVIPWQVIVCVIILFVYQMGKWTSWAEYLNSNNLSGDANVIAGYAQAVQNYTGLMVVLFHGCHGWLKKKLGKALLPVAYIGGILGFAAMILFKSSAMAVIGAGVWGFFYTIHFTTLQFIRSEVTNDRSKALCTSLLLGMPLFANMVANGSAELCFKVLKFGNLTDSGMLGYIIFYAASLIIALATKLFKCTANESK